MQNSINPSWACLAACFASPCPTLTHALLWLPSLFTQPPCFLSTKWCETSQPFVSFTVGSHALTHTSLNATVCWFWITPANIEYFVIRVFPYLCNLSDDEQKAKKKKINQLRYKKQFFSSFECDPQHSWWSNCCVLIHLQRAHTSRSF